MREIEIGILADLQRLGLTAAQVAGVFAAFECRRYADYEARRRSKPVKAPRAPGKRGERFLPDASLSDASREWAISHGLLAGDVAKVFEDFRDYWVSQAGPRGVKLDWPATWRRWVRNHLADKRDGRPRAMTVFQHRQQEADDVIRTLDDYLASKAPGSGDGSG